MSDSRKMEGLTQLINGGAEAMTRRAMLDAASDFATACITTGERLYQPTLELVGLLSWRVGVIYFFFLFFSLIENVIRIIYG